MMIAVGLGCLAIIAPIRAGAQPVVSNVRAQQLTDGTRRVEVYYDLNGASTDGATVSVAFSIDGGNTYAVVPVAAALAGDGGPGIANGFDRRVVWQASSTLPAGLRFDEVRAAVSASETPGGNPVLVSGVPVQGLSGPTDSWAFFKITVPAWQVMLEVRTSGGNGDSDLYLRKGQLPNSSYYSSGSTGAGNEDFFQVWYPDAGDWYVGLRGDAAYAGVSLVATFTDTVPALANGQAVGTLSDVTDHWRFFKITVPAWQVMLEVRTSGGNGDSDLYLRKGQLPNSSYYSSGSTGAGNEDFFQIWYPDAGDWYVGLRADAAYAGVSLVATLTDTVPALANGQTVSNLSDTTDHWHFFKIMVPAWQVMLEVRTSGGNGDSDLYLLKGQLPASVSYTGASTGAGNDAFVQIWYPDAADWYVGLRGDAVYSGVSLLATLTDTVPELTNGQTVGNLADTTDHWQFFKITVPIGQGLLEVSTSGGAGNCDLYLRKGALPSGLSYSHSS